ncbi:MAG TPA: methylated-DNA--[protein]-cysteine S-methyltransferase [Gaiellaceae bacterium]|nr:methylated-DNA--[protein]-cysteine S-methyltransferase [Gaiellaceae bacterium]
MRADVTRYEAPGWGVGELWTAGELVLAHDVTYGASQGGRRGSRPRHPLVERLLAFFAGEEVGFADVRLDLSWATPFQAALVEALRAVPRGEVATYGELAALAGRPGAARAAGALCARNRFAVLVPCHRVVAADGIGGYGAAGAQVKRRLLALEGVVL